MFRRAIELNPNYATAHHWFAVRLMRLGSPRDEALSAGGAIAVGPRSAVADEPWGIRARVLVFARADPRKRSRAYAKAIHDRSDVAHWPIRDLTGLCTPRAWNSFSTPCPWIGARGWLRPGESAASSNFAACTANSARDAEALARAGTCASSAGRTASWQCQRDLQRSVDAARRRTAGRT